MKVGVWDRTEDVNKLKFGGKKLDEDEVFKILSFVQVFGENCWKSIKKTALKRITFDDQCECRVMTSFDTKCGNDAQQYS